MARPALAACSRHTAAMPRFWIAMQVVIVILVLISAVIAVVKL